MDPFVERLRTEMEIWVARGLMDSKSSLAILGAYDRGEIETGAHENSGRFLSIVSILGAICLGAGSILFVASNWEQLPRLSRVAILLVSTFGALFGGFKLAFDSDYPKTGIGLVFTACIIWGASIALIAQIYHIHSDHTSNGLLLWFFGVIPLAYAIQSRAVCGLALAGFLVWISWRFTESYGHWVLLGLFILHHAVGLNLYCLGLFHNYSKTSDGDSGLFAEFSTTYRLFGAIMVSVVAIPLTFHGAIQELSRGSSRLGGAWAIIVVMYFLAIGLSVCAMLSGKRADSSFRIGEGIGLLGLSFLGIILMGLPGSGYDNHLITVAMNLAVLGIVWGLLKTGIKTGAPGLVNIAVLLFAILVLCRYFDMFYSILDRSLFFIGAGTILLFGSIWLERRRRRALELARTRSMSATCEGTAENA